MQGKPFVKRELHDTYRIEHAGHLFSDRPRGVSLRSFAAPHRAVANVRLPGAAKVRGVRENRAANVGPWSQTCQA